MQAVIIGYLTNQILRVGFIEHDVMCGSGIDADVGCVCTVAHVDGYDVYSRLFWWLT